MSLSTDRQFLADVLSTIDGVTGYRMQPKVISPGDAWGLLEILDSPGAYNFMATWKVAVVLPSDPEDAMDFFDSKFQEIADVLNEQFGKVSPIQASDFPTEAGPMLVMILTVVREA